MSMWIKLTPQEAHDFQIPWKMASSVRHHFYSTATLANLYFNGRWPLLGFAFDQESEETVSFQVCEVDLRFINEVNAYNPLDSHIGQGLLLNQPELVNFISILDNIAFDLSQPDQRPLECFNLLSVQECQHYRLPYDFKTDLKQIAFSFTSESDSNGTKTNLIVLTEKTAVFHPNADQPQMAKYQLQLCSFEEKALLDESFMPLADGDSQIEMTRETVKEFACILHQISSANASPLTTPLYLFSLFEPVQM